MLVVMVIASLAVIAAAVLSFRGRLGQMSAERADYVPLDLGPVSATDVALLRPPASLWGYNVQATDEAMEQIAESIRERDVRIVALEQLVTDLGRNSAQRVPLSSPDVRAMHRRARDGIADTETMRWGSTESAWQVPGQSWEGQEPSWREQEQGQPWQEQQPSWPEQAGQPWQEQAGQPWQDHEVAWEQDQDVVVWEPDNGQQGEEHLVQEQEHPWQQEQEQEQARQQEQEQPWQAAEPLWQAPESPSADDSQAPPPERSHD